MLGMVLVHRLPAGERRSGRIVETEAYVGARDGASHARSGPAGRATLMYGPPGWAYVYLIYGMYHCFNAVTETDSYPGAVLVRALEPGDAAADERATGPGLLCQALRIDRRCNGLDLTSSELFLESGLSFEDEHVSMGPRVNVQYAGPWAHRRWRFWVAQSRSVSHPRSGEPFQTAVLDEGLSPMRGL